MPGLRNNFKKIVITLTLVGMLHISSPPPAHAFVFHDPVSLAAHVKQWADQLHRWLQTVQYYAKTVENMVESVTNLKGILKTAEKAFGYSKEMLQTISNIGRTVRTAYKIKTLLGSMVQGRLRAIARIHDNLAHGLFNADEIKRELKNYLLYEMGEVSEQALSAIERQEMNDMTLQMMDLELQLLHKRIAESEKSQSEAADKIEEMRNNPSGVTQLDIQLASLDADNRQYETDLARDRERALQLQRESLERRARIANEVLEAHRFGREMNAHDRAWDKMTEALNDMRKRKPGETEEEPEE